MGAGSASLGDLVQIVGGGTPSTKVARYYEGEIPWVTPKDMKTWAIGDAIEHISEDAIAKSAAKIIPAGAVLVVIRSGVLKHTLPVAITSRPVAINQDMKALICSERVYPPYLGRYLVANQARLLSGVRATTADNLPLDLLKRLRVPLPPIAEQRRIAAILDKADAVRRKRQQTLDLADQFLRSAFLDMFGDPVTNPKGWPVKKLGEVLTFLTSGSRGWAKHCSEEGAAFLRIQNVGRNRLLLDDLARVVPPETKEAERTRLQAGDVVLSITADLGRAAVIPESLGLAHVNQHLGLLRVDGVEPLYLAEFLITGAAQLQFRALDTGQTRSGLNFNDLRRLKVPLPPTELQDGFALLHSKAAAVRASIDRILHVTGMLSGSLTQRAFRGEL